MDEMERLYISWRTEGSYFNKMIHCGENNNIWVENALEYFPKEILWANRENLAFISTAECHACRVARELCEKREIILLSECFFPKSGTAEDHITVRYFNYVVLHEIAHAIKRHKSPMFDNLSAKEKEDQEKEAKELAMTWFNQYVNSRNNSFLKPITSAEIEEAEKLIKKCSNSSSQ